ncbi:hypothetical protein ACKXGF_07770 [Alkalibacillus sp. S2W]|uniref:phage tail protein n=1 Tax=Alkalibacillus sp. S2W TaxID=3386553 RepID=UPI00398D23FC
MANAKRNISFKIKAIDDFTRTMENFERKVNRLENSVKDVPNMSTTNFHAETSEFNKKVDRAERKVDSFPNFVYTHFSSNYKKFRGDLARLSDAYRDFSVISKEIGVGGLLTALPMLSPLVASTAGGLGALSAGLVGAGGAVAGFSAVAVPAITNVFSAREKLHELEKAVANADTEEQKAQAIKALEEHYDSLSDAQQRTIDKMDNFSSFFSDFAKQFETPVLNTFIGGMDALKTILTTLEPLIQSSVKTVSDLMASFNENLGSSDVMNFFTWLNETGAGYLKTFAKAVGNFAVGLMNMLVGFDPLAKSFSEGFLDMSEKFRQWASTLENNEAFQKFLTYVQEQGPKVLNLIGNLATFLVNLGVAMAPLGEKILSLVNSFLQWINGGSAVANIITKLIAYLPVFIGVIKLLATPVLAIINLFRTLWPVLSKAWTYVRMAGPILKKAGAFFLRFINPVTAVITTVVLLGMAIYKHWDKIKAITLKVFSAIGTFLKATWKVIKSAVVNVVTTIKDAIVNRFRQTRDGISNFLTSAWNVIKSIWNSILSFITGVAQSIWQAISSRFQSIVSTISSLLSSAWSTVTRIWNRIKSTISSVLGSVISTVKRKFGNVVDAISGAIGDAKDFVSDGVDRIKGFFDIDLFASGKAMIDSVKDGIVSAKDSAIRKVKEIAGNIRDLWPFSPAKEGPLRDIDKMDFAGPITKSIDKAKNPIVGEMERILNVAEIQNGFKGYNGKGAGLDSSRYNRTSSTENGRVIYEIHNVTELNGKVIASETKRYTDRELEKSRQGNRKAKGLS